MGRPSARPKTADGMHIRKRAHLHGRGRTPRGRLSTSTLQAVCVFPYRQRYVAEDAVSQRSPEAQQLVAMQSLLNILSSAEKQNNRYVVFV